MASNQKRGCKQGQAAGAAVLLAIIVGILVLFIILIPPEERAKILEESTTQDSTTSTASGGLEKAVPEQNLLLTAPGRIDYLAQEEIEHALPEVSIYTRQEAKVLAEKNLAYIKKGVFSKEEATFKFVVSDPPNTENILLSFKINEASGRLIIKFNGEEVYNAAVEGGNILSLRLPQNYLKENNEIIFQVSSPGALFWKTNEASLENIKVVADVTNLEAQSSRSIFLISDTEKRNLDKALLKFQPSCLSGEAGKLTIHINGREVYSGLPDCGVTTIPLEFSADFLVQGENEIIFKTEKGNYLLSHLLIKSKLKEVEFPTYYFELSYEQYQAVKDGRRRIRLFIDFVDVVVSKYGELVFNGHLINYDTKENNYFVDLSDDAVPGNNALKIKPRKTVEIRELRVDLIK